MYIEYIYILKYFFIILIFFIILFSISFFFVYQKLNFNKTSSYECGFNPFADARMQFEIKFYLIGILFIIFDIEISYLFPWVLNFYNLNFIALFSMIFFIFLLTLGFVYEWKKGALNW